MADPLSIIASIAGIATAGFQLASKLFEIVDAVRSAPQEIAYIAEDMFSLSQLLTQLSNSFEQCRGLYKPQLINITRDLLWRFQIAQDAMHTLIKGCDGFRRLLFVFKSQKIRGVMLKIEGLKGTLSLAMQILTIASTEKKSEKCVKFCAKYH
jgi:hypothetical protein